MISNESIKSCDHLVKATLSVVLLTYSFFLSEAQTGPAGVGATDGSSTLMYWVDANQQAEATGGNLTSISDLSGGSVLNTIVGNPVLIENYVNQRNAINFNGIDQQVTTSTYINAGLYPDLTVIAVYEPSVTYARSVWGDYQSGWEGRYLTDNNFNLPRTSNFVGPGFDPPDDHPSGSIPNLFSANQWVISAVVFSEGVTDGTVVRVNGSIESTFTSYHSWGAYNQFVWGAGGNPGAAYPFWFAGNIAELIVFSEALNDLDLVVLENYLSAKYDIALASSDLYTGDDAGFDFDVAGVGRLSPSVARVVTQGTGIVTIEAPDIGVDEFLIWGHNNGSLAANETSDVPEGVEGRSERIWYVNEVNSTGSSVDAGSVNITFRLSAVGPVVENDLVLLIDSNGDGLFADETIISGAHDMGNNDYQFQNVTTLSSGSRFTLGSSNISSTPLPIALINFDVQVVDDSLLEFWWSTATEHNNDYFEVLTSHDGMDWQLVVVTDGKGNTNELSTYRVYYNDRHTIGRTYYKLRQVDFDGTSTEFEIKKIDRGRGDEVNLFPNPADISVNIHADKFEHADIYDSRLSFVKSSSDTLIHVSDLKAGMYFVYVYAGHRLWVKKLFVNTRH